MTLLIPCVYPIIWLLVAILMLLKWIFIDGWFIWATLGVIWIAFYLVKGIRIGFNSIGETKKKRQSKTDFLESLVKTFSLPTVDNVSNVDKQLTKTISTVISRMSCDSSAISLFDKVVNECNNNYGLSSATVSTGTLDPNIGSINGSNLNVHNGGWEKVDSSVRSFYMKWETGCLYLYPYFCIYEKPDGIELIEWKNIDISSSKGNPSYHSYLHERVGGGPDRRYSYNPLIPVYLYSALVFKIAGDSINVVLQGEDEAEKFEKILREFKKILASTGGVSISMDVQAHDVEKDEYATLFKSIVDERGKDIVKEKLFISMLADYKVFREKTYLRPLLVTMTEEGYWTELTEGNPSVDTLNRIKKKFITIHQYPEHEVTEAMAYIGYGLGITA